MKKENRGGSRLNSGAKPKYTEPTKTTAFRIPISKIDELKKLVRDFLASYERENNQYQPRITHYNSQIIILD